MSQHAMTAFPTARPVGFWRWYRPDVTPAYPSIANLWSRLEQETAYLTDPIPGSCSLTNSERASLIAYLQRDDHVRVGYCGAAQCRLCDATNGSEDVCDGTYVWPSGLAHYVEEHQVELPGDFVAHVLRGATARQEEVCGWVAIRQGATIGPIGLGAVQATAKAALDRAREIWSGWPKECSELVAVPVSAVVVGGYVVRVERT